MPLEWKRTVGMAGSSSCLKTSSISTRGRSGSCLPWAGSDTQGTLGSNWEDLEPTAAKTGWTADSPGQRGNSSGLLYLGVSNVGRLINSTFGHTYSNIKVDMSKF